jgi:hypothetical protein
MQLRRFNPSGIEAFRQFLAACREDASTAVPVGLLEDDEHTSVVRPEIEIEPQDFKIKRDAADYFHEKLATLAADKLANDSGLWTWLSLFYFEQVCPSTAGKRKPRNDYTYVFVPKSMRDTYRHILFACWNVLRVSPTFNQLFLHSRIDQMDKYNSEVFKRLYLTRIPCVFEVLDRLYWDEEAGRPQTGIVNPRNTRAGNLMHRFPIRIRQLEKTYDLQSLAADQLLELLGSEFQQIHQPM